jgi:tetratricopeptide (TPR) repeat protein
LQLALVHIEMGHALELKEDTKAAYERYVRAADVSRAVVESAPNLVSARQRLAAGLQAAGKHLLDIGRPSEALECFLEARQALAGVAASNPKLVELQSSLANAYCFLGDTFQWLNRFQDADRAYRSGLVVLDRLDESASQRTFNQKVAGGIHQGLGTVLERQGLTEEAIESFALARQIRETMKETLNNAESLDQLAKTLDSLAVALRKKGDLEQATALGERACEIGEQLLAMSPDSGSAQGALGAHHNNLGLTYKALGDHVRAAEHFEQAVEHQQIAVRLLPDHLQYTNFLANHYCNLAGLHDKDGELSEAVADYRTAADVREAAMQRHPDDQGIVATAARNYLELAHTQTRAGDKEDAEANYERAIELYEQLPESAARQSANITSALEQARDALTRLRSETD